jgi:uncharacterized protein (TIGR02996 family)
MVPTLTPTEAGLIRAVVAEPDADLHRLAYADFLDDRDGPGDRAHAEFVRVQVELAGLPECHVTTVDDGDGDPGGWPCRCPWHALRRRERELLGRHYRRWLPPSLRRVLSEAEESPAFFRRGFVESVRLPLAAWLEHGPALVASCPLARVGVTDREPLDADETLSSLRVQPGWAGWYAWELDDYHDPEDLPEALWRLLPGDPVRVELWKWYPSAADARDALSAACLAFARRPR